MSGSEVIGVEIIKKINMGTDNSYSLDMWGNPPRTYCECCNTRMAITASTSTTCPQHKWTQKEIEEQIFALCDMLISSTFWTRGDIVRKLVHWTAKRNMLLEAKAEFEIINKASS